MNPAASKTRLRRQPVAKAGTVPRPPKEEIGPRGCSNFLLRQLMRRVDQHFDAELAKAGLKTTQYSLLSHIVRLEPLTPGELARAMKMQPSTLTRNLQPLILAGWAELGPGADARTRSITCTPAGREKHAQAQRHWKAAQLGINALLGGERVTALHDMIGQWMGVLADTQTRAAARTGEPDA